MFRFTNEGHKDKSGQKWVLRVMIFRALYNINLPTNRRKIGKIMCPGHPEYWRIGSDLDPFFGGS